MERVGIFVDAQHVMAAQRTLGWNVDYNKLFLYWQKQYGVYNAFYYTRTPLVMTPQLRGFLNVLPHLGYTVREKLSKEIHHDDTHLAEVKANVSIDMVIDMMNTVMHWDVCVLYSGDHELARVVQWIREQGKIVMGCSVPTMMSRELEEECTAVVWLNRMQKWVSR